MEVLALILLLALALACVGTRSARHHGDPTTPPPPPGRPQGKPIGMDD